MLKIISIALVSKLLACDAGSVAIHSFEALGVSLVQLRANAVSNSSSSRPHIVFVLADDLGWNGVGYTGGKEKKVKTPYIDKLAEHGVRLDAYYAAVYCAPSRFAFLTGRSPWKSESGAGNFRNDNPIGTSTAYHMLPSAYHKAGYKTHLVGKWHQGFHMKSYLPTHRGFDTFFGIGGGCTDHNTQEIMGEGGNLECAADGIKDLWEDDKPAVKYSPGEFGDDMYRDRAVQLILSHDQSKPFFLFLSLQAPHEPYEVPSQYASKYSLSEHENVYWGMHSHVDETVQAVYKALNDANMYSDTILIFTSDNGATAEKYRAPYFANYPLRGHKGQLYEGAIHVPCFVTGGRLPSAARGRILKGLMGVEDWYATLAHFSGAQPTNAGPFLHDSIDNWAYIIGEKSESARKEIVHHHIGAGVPAMRMSILRNDKYKAVAFGKSKEACEECKLCTPQDPCVYDLEKDPGETTDVSHTVRSMVENYIIPRMDETYNDAYKQAFFGTGAPGQDKVQQHKACKVWAGHNGFLGTWATSKDEESFVRRVFSSKVELAVGTFIQEADDPALNASYFESGED